MAIEEAVLNTTNSTGNSTGILGNEIINTTLAKVSEKASDAAAVAHSFLPLIFIRLWDLVAAPFRNPQMLWIIFPLFFTFIVMEFYFERHGDEELGWGAAVANSLILIIVSIDLIRHSFHQAAPWEVLREIALAIFGDQELPVAPVVLILVLFLGALGLAITLINYFHLLPRKLAFELSGHPPINFLAYFSIAIVYSVGTEHEIPLDIPALIAGVILFLLLLLAVFGLRRLFGRFLGGRGSRFRD